MSKEVSIIGVWRNAKLGEYLYVKNGFAFKSKDYIKKNDDTVPIIRIADIYGKYSHDNNASHILTDNAKLEFTIKKNDLLIAMSGATTGKFGVYIGKEPAFQNQRVGNIKLYSKLLGDEKFRNFLIASISEHILKIAYGGAQPNISSKAIEEIEFLLPPLAEQQEISRRLDRLLGQVDSIKNRIDKIPALLKKFRQSVLASAVSGKLTEDWRGREELAGWEEKKLSTIGNFARGKSKHRPRNDKRLFGAEYPFIQTGEVANSGGSISSASKFYSEFGLAQSKLFPKGTLCITIAANIADTAILGIDACFPDSIVAYTPNTDLCEVKFIKFLIDTNKANLESFAPATAQKNINLGILNKLKFKIPPLLEQTEIVNRVEKLFAFADTIEARVKEAQSRVNKLTQSILAKAFRGDLTKEWRLDNEELISGENSAEALLNKIKAEREKLSPKKKKTTARKPREKKC